MHVRKYMFFSNYIILLPVLQNELKNLYFAHEFVAKRILRKCGEMCRFSRKLDINSSTYDYVEVYKILNEIYYSNYMQFSTI